jgi:hypothetical protein
MNQSETVSRTLIKMCEFHSSSCMHVKRNKIAQEEGSKKRIVFQDKRKKFSYAFVWLDSMQAKSHPVILEMPITRKSSLVKPDTVAQAEMLHPTLKLSLL